MIISLCVYVSSTVPEVAAVVRCVLILIIGIVSDFSLIGKSVNLSYMQQRSRQ